MELSRMVGPRRLAFVAFLVGLGVLGVAQAVTLDGTVARQNPSMHVALDVMEGMIALSIAYLMVARVRDSGEVTDALSLYALVVLGLSKVVLLGIPTVAAGTRGDLQLLSAPIGRVIGASALALAAAEWIPRKKLPKEAVRYAAVAATLTVLLVAAISNLVLDGVPKDPSSAPVLWLHGLTAVALAIAAAGFVQRATRSGDEMLAWFGAGCALGSVSRIGYVVFPALEFDDVYIQDLLRLGFYVLLLVGAQRELNLYWRSRTEAAALEERRRVARDLHDGLAQELVYITGQVKRLQKDRKSDPALDQVASAADRAVSEARRAIAALTRSTDQTLCEALEELGDEFKVRYDVQVRFDLDESVDLSADHREEVLRIAREAMNNAIRHANPKVITLCLSKQGGVSLEIQDDGSGFDQSVGRAKEGGFGLISMRERAEAIGGDLEIESSANEGTKVRVKIPSR